MGLKAIFPIMYEVILSDRALAYRNYVCDVQAKGKSGYPFGENAAKLLGSILYDWIPYAKAPSGKWFPRKEHLDFSAITSKLSVLRANPDLIQPFSVPEAEEIVGDAPDGSLWRYSHSFAGSGQQHHELVSVLFAIDSPPNSPPPRGNPRNPPRLLITDMRCWRAVDNALA